MRGLPGDSESGENPIMRINVASNVPAGSGRPTACATCAPWTKLVAMAIGMNFGTQTNGGCVRMRPIAAPEPLPSGAMGSSDARDGGGW